jgi:hypothetical protein
MRRCEATTLIRGDMLFQQYIVDAFASIEENRLRFIVKNNKNLRSEVYKGIEDALHKGDVDGNSIGKRVILPASFTLQGAKDTWSRTTRMPWPSVDSMDLRTCLLLLHVIQSGRK